MLNQKSCAIDYSTIVNISVIIADNARMMTVLIDLNKLYSIMESVKIKFFFFESLFLYCYMRKVRILNDYIIINCRYDYIIVYVNIILSNVL